MVENLDEILLEQCGFALGILLESCMGETVGSR